LAECAGDGAQAVAGEVLLAVEDLGQDRGPCRDEERVNVWPVNRSTIISQIGIPGMTSAATSSARIRSQQIMSARRGSRSA
jgi:hypothetical protein